MSKIKVNIARPLGEPERVCIIVTETHKEPINEEGHNIEYSIMDLVKPEWIVPLRDALNEHIDSRTGSRKDDRMGNPTTVGQEA